jgi:hypothetical protein
MKSKLHASGGDWRQQLPSKSAAARRIWRALNPNSGRVSPEITYQQCFG